MSNFDETAELPKVRARSFPSLDAASRWFQLAVAALEGGADARGAIDGANEVSMTYEESYDALKKKTQSDRGSP